MAVKSKATAMNFFGIESTAILIHVWGYREILHISSISGEFLKDE